MISYQRDLQGAALPCDAATFWHITDSRKVSDICQQIDQVVNGPTDDGRSYEQQTEQERRTRHEQAGLLKKQLPSFCFMATFPRGHRLKSEAVPTGLVMLDVDDMEHPRQWYEQQAFTPQRLGEMGICYMGETPSRHGLRAVFRGQGGSIAQEQQRMAALLGVTPDPACKDLSRMSFAVPRSYIFHLNEEMFENEESKLTIENGELRMENGHAAYDGFGEPEKRQTIVNAIAQARRAEAEGHGGMPYRLKRVLEALKQSGVEATGQPKAEATATEAERAEVVEQPTARRKSMGEVQAAAERQKQVAAYERRLLQIALPCAPKQSHSLGIHRQLSGGSPAVVIGNHQVRKFLPTIRPRSGVGDVQPAGTLAGAVLLGGAAAH